MAEVKGIYVKKLPIAVGSQKQIHAIESIVQSLLSACQKKYDVKYNFIHYISMTYEPGKVTEKLFDYEEISFKEFLNELKKVKVKISAVKQKELLVLYENSVDDINLMTKQIEMMQQKLDFIVFDLYEISDVARHRIVESLLSK